MDAYTREELESLPLGAKPNRGQYCPKCKCLIPEFADIPPDMAAKLRQMHAALAFLAIRELTGCPLDWAKTWRGHPNGPHREFGQSDACRRARIAASSFGPSWPNNVLNVERIGTARDQQANTARRHASRRLVVLAAGA